MHPFYVRLLIAAALLIIFLICGWLDSRRATKVQQPVTDPETEFHAAMRRLRNR